MRSVPLTWYWKCGAVLGSCRKEAEARAARLRERRAAARLDVESAFQNQDWLALGYDTWEDYCRDMLEAGEVMALDQEPSHSDDSRDRQGDLHPSPC